MTRNEVVWAQNIGKSDIPLVGGKGANLGEMIGIGLPVPPAFVVSAPAFHRFITESGIATKIFEELAKVDVEDPKALREASDRAREAVLRTKMPEPLDKQIREAYRSLAKSEGVKEPLVAVRSSATAEDLPEASFAGQQDTYLNVRGEDALLEHIQKCWASLYTPRAIYYRAKHRFPHDKVAIAVVVQVMVDAAKAGVLFTKHPTSGADVTLIEAAWGLGEGVVSGHVTPDHYEMDGAGKVAGVNVATKETMYVRGKHDRTVVEPVPANKKSQRVVTDEELKQLFGLGRTVERHYGTPQDIEWAIAQDGRLHVLQARPITTIQKTKPAASGNPGAGSGAEKTILSGLGASPGRAVGKVAIVASAEELDKCRAGDILVTQMTTPDMVPAMRRAAAIVTDEGGMTCHAAIVSRELGVPAVVGTKAATRTLKDGQTITVDGEKGHVMEGGQAPAPAQANAQGGVARAMPQLTGAKPLTATQVKVNISMPEAIDRAMAVDPDGVGLLRIEHIVLGLGKHPLSFVRGGKEKEYVDYLVKSIKAVVEPMYPRTVWIRTLDAPTDEFRAMEGGGDEPHEHNPMLGWRGIRRGLEQQDLLSAEFKAIRRLVDDGFTNLGVMLPLVQRPEEIREAKRLLRAAGVEPHKDCEFGVMVEIPAAALIIDQLLDEGLDFVSFGTNDLTQYTLAVDRNNENVAKLYDEFHPAVGKLIQMTIEACRPRGVQTSICGQAGSNPKFVEKLVAWGITSVSANIDAVPRVRETVARAERRMLLDKARGK
ncbi:MAG TPA: phosphoenolpyruvate synthase [Candidatus Thermoplasmatota archaeon]|nr:phosphoenolpyruvate synthase [Candidatus Thermoplasmatota archaeon]